MSRQSDGVPMWHGDVLMTADATGLNALAGFTGVASDIDKIASFTGTTANLNALSGLSASTAELNLLDGYTGTTAELSQMAGTLLTDMTPGTGISGEANAICNHQVVKVGGIYRTEIYIDVTDLQGGGTIDDIVGGSGDAVNSHIGQITAAINGTIIAAKTLCLEAPAGGDPDIEIWRADDATLAGDYLITGEDDEIQLVAGGDLTLGSLDYWTALPAANSYLYMVCGTVTDVQYTAGKFVLTLWGV